MKMFAFQIFKLHVIHQFVTLCFQDLKFHKAENSPHLTTRHTTKMMNPGMWLGLGGPDRKIFQGEQSTLAAVGPLIQLELDLYGKFVLRQTHFCSKNTPDCSFGSLWYERIWDSDVFLFEIVSWSVSFWQVVNCSFFSSFVTRLRSVWRSGKIRRSLILKGATIMLWLQSQRFHYFWKITSYVLQLKAFRKWKVDTWIIGNRKC